MTTDPASPNPRVSVVIPCHNYARFLPEAIDSVLAQTLPAHEIWVVDDSSTDETPDVIQQYGSAIRSLRVEGRGAYGARNDSLPHLSGDFFLNLDADNQLEPTFIEATSTALQKADPSIGYVYTQRHYFGNRTGLSRFPAFDPEVLRFENFVDMGSLIRMDLVRQFRFDEGFNRGRGDHQFFLRLLQAGIQGLLLDQPLLHYREHENSITSGVRKRLDQIRIQKKILTNVPDLYTPDQARKALQDARNRVLVSLIQRRSPDAGVITRLKDTLLFARHGWRHQQFQQQLRYLLHPSSNHPSS